MGQLDLKLRLPAVVVVGRQWRKIKNRGVALLVVVTWTLSVGFVHPDSSKENKIRITVPTRVSRIDLIIIQRL